MKQKSSFFLPEVLATLLLYQKPWLYNVHIGLVSAKAFWYASLILPRDTHLISYVLFRRSMACQFKSVSWQSLSCPNFRKTKILLCKARHMSPHIYGFMEAIFSTWFVCLEIQSITKKRIPPVFNLSFFLYISGTAWGTINLFASFCTHF